MLRYRYMNTFDAAMNYAEGVYNWLSAPQVSDISHHGVTDTDLTAHTQAYISLKNEVRIL